MALGGEAQYLINENRRMAEQRGTGGSGGSGGDGFDGCLVWLVIGVILFGLIIGGVVSSCSDDTADNTEAIQEELTDDEEKDLGLNLTQEIKLTDSYAFALPEEAEQSPDAVDTSDGFTDEKVFIWDDGNMVARSFIIPDEPDCFPGLVEYLYEGTGTSLDYSTFFDTGLATGKDKTEDVDGTPMYRTAYFWPDGPDTLCCIEILGYHKGSRNQAKAILDSVKYDGLSQAAFAAENAGYNPYDDHPTYEEFQDELYREYMEDEYKRAMQEDYEDNWGCQPY